MATAQSVAAISVWRDAVDKAVTETKIGAPSEDKGKRDLAIAYSTALIMAQYGTVRTSLMSGRAAASIAFDILGLGLTSAVPISNGARGKTILGGLATGFKGTQLSIDRSLFNQQTTSAILTAMDTCVLRQRKLLGTKRALPVADYSMYDAYSDLVYLYGCTTLAGAMEELVETQSVAARQEKENTTIVLITEVERDQFKAAQAAYIASVDGDKKLALDFLKAMDVQNLSAESPKQEFIDAYQKLGFEALSKEANKSKFLAAATKVKLIK